MRGRSRKPTALKLIEGNPGKRPLPPAEPQPDRLTDLAPPPGLDDGAADAWKYLAPLLDRMGVLTAGDVLALSALCQAWAEAVACRERLRGYGSTTYEAATQAGGTMRRSYPEVGQLADLDRRIRAWLTDFGLTPAARARVQVRTPGEADPAEGYFDG